MGIDFGGGPYYGPEESRWEAEDGCPDCGGKLNLLDDILICDSCEHVFYEDGVPMAAGDVEELDVLYEQ